jgi:hypothetical protein
MTEKSTIAGLISKAAKKLRDDFEYIRETNSHSGEKGGETEDKVRGFLNGHIPKRFHATAGFVIDVDNQMSDHQDVIIYDAQSSPVYRYEGDNQIVSADAVAAIMEVKSVLNKSQLENAYEKIAEVKRLKKCPISDMDQKATAGSLTTTGTLGIVLGFTTDIELDTLAAHCVEFNEKYETFSRPDIVVVLDVGVINYVAEFAGMRQTGDYATATSDDGPIPPCYVHLVSRADGAYSLNRLFTHLISHLAFYPRRPSIPPFSVLLEGTSSINHTLGTYQYNTENRLVPYQASPLIPSEKRPFIKITDKASKEEMATLTFIPWQDGGVIKKMGKAPLIAFLALFTKGRPPMTMKAGDSELSMVMKVTRPEFEKWPAILERQSNNTFSATLEIPPQFEAREIADEGTSEPFIARIFLGIMEATSNMLSPQEKHEFDERFAPMVVQPALTLRSSLLAIRKLLADHKEALRTGRIVRKAQVDPLLSERIDGPIRSHTVNFLEMAATIIEGLPLVMKFFQINIDFLADREERFARGCERVEAKHPQLSVYLQKLRPTILEVERQFKTMRFGGWNLPNVRYNVAGKIVTMAEPEIDGEPVSKYTERVFSTLMLAVEEMIMYGFSIIPRGNMGIAEVPLNQRNPINAQRFKRTMRGHEPLWEFRWTGRSFYES